MKYVIMCGGHYDIWQRPRHLTRIDDDTLIERTAKLLKKAGVSNHDIYVSTNNTVLRSYCDAIKIKVLWTENNSWVVPRPGVSTGDWCDCFYPTGEPTCYLMGDVVFSPEAIKKIVYTNTEDIEFFASAPPFAPNYIKKYAEPFAFKVENTGHLRRAKEECKQLHKRGSFKRSPIAWEFWQVVKETQLNHINYNNYTVINDYTCDIDTPEDIDKIKEVMS